MRPFCTTITGHEHSAHARQPADYMNKQDMAEEALFLLLHNEIVSCVYKAGEQGEVVSLLCVCVVTQLLLWLVRFTKMTCCRYWVLTPEMLRNNPAAQSAPSSKDV